MSAILSPGVYVAGTDYSDIFTTPKYQVIGYILDIDSGIVDGNTWYTVAVNEEMAKWIKEQDKSMWASALSNSIKNVFDIHNELMVILKLKWQA